MTTEERLEQLQSDLYSRLDVIAGQLEKTTEHEVEVDRMLNTINVRLFGNGFVDGCIADRLNKAETDVGIVKAMIPTLVTTDFCKAAQLEHRDTGRWKRERWLPWALAFSLVVVNTVIQVLI